MVVLPSERLLMALVKALVRLARRRCVATSVMPVSSKTSSVTRCVVTSRMRKPNSSSNSGLLFASLVLVRTFSLPHCTSTYELASFSSSPMLRSTPRMTCATSRPLC